MNKKTLEEKKCFTPPEEVAEAAKKGLLLKEKFNRGGTEVGWERAKQLKQRAPVSSSEIIKIANYFSRHEVDKKAKNFGNESNPSKGYIAWLLWGGEPGKKWAKEIKKQLKS
jgi:hypothetical protein